jgi:hypothetical protein
MRAEGRPSVAFPPRTPPRADRSGGLEVPPAVLDGSQEAGTKSSSISIFSEGVNSESAVVVHGIPSSSSRESITSILNKFGSVRRVKHIKFSNSSKTRCLVDFFCRGVAKHLIQVGFIRCGEKYLKVSDPKKFARLQAHLQGEEPGSETTYVWGPQGRTVIPKPAPRGGQASRPGRAQQPRERLAPSAEPTADGRGLPNSPGCGPDPQPPQGRPTLPSSAVPGLTAGSRAPQSDCQVDMRNYEIHVDQDIVTTYRIKHRGVIYQQVVHSSNGWFLSSYAYPTQLLN